MPATIPVGSVPQKISGTASKPYLITNDPDSPSEIYLGQDSSVSPFNYGIKLTPGSSLTWQEITKEVWAVTSTGTAVVTVLYEASATVSGQVSNLASVNPQLLQTLTIPFASPSTGLPIDRFLDTQLIQQYAAVRIMVSVNITQVASAGLLDLVSGAFIQFSGIQSNTILSNSTSGYQETNSALWTFGDGIGYTLGLAPAIQTLDFPVVNNYLTSSWIRYDTGSTATDVIGTITIRVFGLYNVVSNEERYQNFPGSARTPIWGVMYNNTFSSNVNVAIASQNGAATVGLATNAITPTNAYYVLSYFTSNAVSRQPIFRQKLDAPGTLNDNKQNTFILPNAPIYLQLVFAGTGSAMFSLIQTRR